MDNERNNAAADSYNISRVRSCINAVLDDPQISSVLGSEFVGELKEWDTLIGKKMDEPFTLVILGEFKRGKSTIINAILGKELTPTNATPETYTINEISFGNFRTVQAFLENGRRIPLTIEDIKREKLEQRMKLFPSKIAYVQIKDNSPILNEIKIVDTPGLSDLETLDKEVRDYIVNADAIMYTASCLMPFSETEQTFLLTHVLPQRFGMLYILVNMLDALESRQDANRVLRRFKSIAGRIVPNAVVYGISGADEFARRMGTERPDDKGFRDLYETQFLQFELSLKRDIIMQKDVIRSQRVLTMLSQMWAETNTKLNLIAEMADLDQQKLAEKVSAIESKGQELEAALEAKKPQLHLGIIEMQQEAEKWMYEFFSKLRASILLCRSKDENGEDKYSAEDIEKYFYPYLMEKVGLAYRTCIEHHRDKIALLVEKISHDLSESLGIEEYDDESKAPSVERIMMSVNKNVTRSVMGVKLFGTSETFPPATMSSFSLIMKKKKQTDIIDIALENYDDIRNNIVKDIKTVYQDLETKALSRLEGLYKYQLSLNKEAISQTQEMIGQLGDSEIKAAIAKARDLLREPEDILKQYGYEV